jgi:hypothetical protein
MKLHYKYQFKNFCTISVDPKLYIAVSIQLSRNIPSFLRFVILVVYKNGGNC